MKELLFLFGIILSVTIPLQARLINTEKFKNLDCSQIQKLPLFTKLEPSFSNVSSQLPIKNYSFNWGFYSLANCWSLSRLQRAYFYLNERSNISSRNLADTIRGFSPYQSEFDRWNDWPVDPSIMPQYGSQAWQELTKGIVQEGEFGGRITRTINGEIENYQVRRFHDLDNLKYLKGPIARTPIENQQTIELLDLMLSKNQLPLVLIRPHNYSQHVVVAKRIENRKIIVYDSNYPTIENEMYFDDQFSLFYAPKIIRGLPHVENEFIPVGVFVVDSGDLKPIQNSLSAHYQGLCSE